MPTMRPPFVGRQQELTALLARLDAAAAGEGGVVLLAGAPGPGKTRLLGELGERAAALGWLVLAGRADDGAGLPPYLPFSEALRGYIRACPDDELRHRLGRAAAEVALLVPELADRLPDLPPRPAISPEHERYRLFENVCDLLLALAQGTESRGLLLLLDDLHWADKPSLLLLQHLARRLAGARLLLVGAFRREDLGGEHPLLDVLAVLRREALGESVDLTALADDEAAQLTAALAGVAPAVEVAATIQRRSEGNPFFLGELVRHLQRDGIDLTDAQPATERWRLPAGVREVIGRRLARLSAAAQSALQSGAVLGDGFAFAELRETCGIEEEPLLDTLDVLAAAGLLREAGPGYQFGHALIRETVYAGLSLPRRERLHRRAAEALERLYSANLVPHVAALASHWRLAGAVGDAAKALAYTRQAAQQAETVFAWEVAAAHWQAALAAVEAGPPLTPLERCELLLALGQAQYRSGELSLSRRSYWQAAASAREASEAVPLARAALGYGEFAGSSDATANQIALLEEALGQLPEKDRWRVRVIGLLVESLPWSVPPELERADALSREAVALARQLEDPAALAYALRQRHWQLLNASPTAERRDIATEMCAIAEKIGDLVLLEYGERFKLMNALEGGDIVAVDQAIAHLTTLAERAHDGYFLPQIAAFQAMSALLDGRFDETRRLVAAAEDSRFGDAANAPLLGWVRRNVLITINQLLGDDPAMLEEATEGVRLTATPQLVQASLLFASRGQHSEARSTLTEVINSNYGGMRRSGAWSFMLTRLAQVCATIADRGLAVEFRQQLPPFSGRTAMFMWGFVCTGAVDHYLGLLDATLQDWDAAERHFQSALALNERMAARPFLAQTQREYAAMLLRRGRRADVPRARELLTKAIAAYDELGMGYWASKARALLADRRLASAPVRVAYPNGLSAREVEVLRLAAAGKSNREVAEALVISVNTVLRHVNHIFAKTGAQNRVEAAAYALRRGLVE
ncbi:MAG TPA: AAA family ATPase [Dehalococcoidia bacterium]|nr:AAA family ATPase [Dehalococcoidia bacterium]